MTPTSSPREPLFSRDFTLISLANLTLCISFYFLLTYLPLYLKSDRGYSESEIGLIQSAFAFASIFARPFTGVLLDRYSRKKIYLTPFLLFGLFFAGYPLLQTFSLLVLLRIFHGACWGALSSSGNTIAIDITPPSRRGEGIGVFGLSMTLAMAVGPIIATKVQTGVSSAVAFPVALVVCLLAFVPASCVRPVKMNAEKKPLRLSALLSKDALPTAAVILFINIAYGAILTYIALYAKTMGFENVWLFYFLLAIGICVTRFLAGRLYDQIGPLGIMTVSALVLLASLPVAILTTQPMLFYAIAFVIGLGFGAQMITTQAMANEGVPVQRRGATNATYLALFDLGISFGMLIYGFLIKGMGYTHALLTLGVWVVISFVWLLLVGMKHYKTKLTTKG